MILTAEQFWATLPHCCGYPKCDGDLVATEHSEECPLHGKKEMTLFEFANTYAAERTERQLAELRERMVCGHPKACLDCKCFYPTPEEGVCQNCGEILSCTACAREKGPANAKATLDALIASAEAKGRLEEAKWWRDQAEYVSFDKDRQECTCIQCCRKRRNERIADLEKLANPDNAGTSKKGEAERQGKP